MFLTSLERFYAVTNKDENILIYPHAPIHELIKWYHIVISNYVKEDGLSEIIKSTYETKPSKSN